MRAAVLLVLSAAAPAAAFPVPKVRPPAPPPAVTSPAGQLRLAVADLAARVDPRDGPFVRYLSFATVPPEKAAEFRVVFRWWVNHLSAARSLVREVEVPGSSGTLVRIDIRDAPNWTRAAWEVVGNRDYLFREPWLPHREAAFLRLATGVRQDPKTLAAVSLLNAYQLFRDSVESQRLDRTGRASTYYDLLYAAERHPDGALAFAAVVGPGDPGPEPRPPAGEPWPGGVFPGDGKAYPKGAFTWVRKADQEEFERAHAAWEAGKAGTAAVVPKAAAGGPGDPNFPATGADFERRWDAEVKAEDLKKFLVDPRFGGVARGAENDPTAGSFVALSDRVVRIVKTRFGWAARTFDTAENAGDKDYLERPLDIARGTIAFDGGELLATLPNGAQAGLLVNGQDARQEIAPTFLAQNRNPKLDKYADVRTHMSCVACHAGAGGYVPFAEAVQDAVKKGLRAVADPEKRAEAQRVADFFTRWERQVRSLTEPYQAYTEEATATPAEPRGWTPAATVKAFQAARDWYDLPVTLAVAAREFGLSARDLRTALLDLGGGRESVRTRVNQLATDQPVPRRAWEADVAREVGLILDTLKPREEPLKELVSDALLADAIQRFGKAPTGTPK